MGLYALISKKKRDMTGCTLLLRALAACLSQGYFAKDHEKQTLYNEQTNIHSGEAALISKTTCSGQIPRCGVI